jgi:NCS1 family nucleobase:cation symporter-1
MAAVVGPTVVDYMFVTKGNMWISHLYDGSRSNPRYYYTKGWSINGYVAYIAGIALPFAGFVGTLGASVSVTAQRMGHLGWLLSFFVSAFVYYICCLINPTPAQRAVKAEGLGWEQLAREEPAFSSVVLEAESENGGSEETETGGKHFEASHDSPITETL